MNERKLAIFFISLLLSLTKVNFKVSQFINRSFFGGDNLKTVMFIYLNTVDALDVKNWFNIILFNEVRTSGRTYVKLLSLMLIVCNFINLLPTLTEM